MSLFLLYSAQVSLISLIALMIYRVISVYQEHYPSHSEPSILDEIINSPAAANTDYEIKMECLKQAQIFANVQTLDVKRNFPQLGHESMGWLNLAISLYLIGAVDYIGKQARCAASTRKELISLVLKSNLNLSTEITDQYYQEALYRRQSSENDLMIRAGAKAAKAWQTDDSVPEQLSLSFQLNDWGVFA